MSDRERLNWYLGRVRAAEGWVQLLVAWAAFEFTLWRIKRKGVK